MSDLWGNEGLTDLGICSRCGKDRAVISGAKCEACAGKPGFDFGKMSYRK